MNAQRWDMRPDGSLGPDNNGRFVLLEYAEDLREQLKATDKRVEVLNSHNKALAAGLQNKGLCDEFPEKHIAELERERDEAKAEAKRRFLDDFHSHPYVKGLQEQHERDHLIALGQFERAEEAEDRIRKLEAKVKDGATECPRCGSQLPGPPQICRSCSTTALREAEQRVTELAAQVTHITGDRDKYYRWHEDQLAATKKAERRVADLEVALGKINKIRNSIVGAQSVNWSAHIYPLVAALDAAGYVGAEYEKARADVQIAIEKSENGGEDA
jgi:ribosomal protein L40E